PDDLRLIAKSILALGRAGLPGRADHAADIGLSNACGTSGHARDVGRLAVIRKQRLGAARARMSDVAPWARPSPPKNPCRGGAGLGPPAASAPRAASGLVLPICFRNCTEGEHGSMLPL